MNTAACTVSGLATARPTHPENAVSATPNITTTITMPIAAITPLWKRKPISRDARHEEQRLDREAGAVAHGAADQEGRAGDRQRAQPVDHAALEVVGDADARPHRRERHRLDEHGRDDEVLVADRPVDRGHRPEHEGEEDQLHQRLDRAEHDQLRVAQHAAQVATGDEPDVGEDPRRRERGALLGGALAHRERDRGVGHEAFLCSAACPVSFRKTSSSDGRRRVRSASSRPTPSSARTASVSATAPVDDRRLDAAEVRVDHEVVAREPEGAGDEVRRGVEAVPVAQREVEHVAADPGLQLVGGALGDDVAAVDHADALRELVGLLEVLRRQDDRGALVPELLDHVPELEPAAWVETGGGLVEEEHRRRHHQAAGQVEAPPHAARVGPQQPVARIGQRERRQHPVGPLLGPVLRRGGTGARRAPGSRAR